MKRPVAFVFSTLVVLSAAGLVFYSYGLPMLAETGIGCRFGGGTKSLGCSTSFGTFIALLSAAVALLIAGIWNRFGRD